jgi:hypothetical protein
VRIVVGDARGRCADASAYAREEEATIEASVKGIWRYESQPPNPLIEFYRGAPRRPRLRPFVLKARVLRTIPRYATAVVALRDARGTMRDTPWLVVFQVGSKFTPGGWGLIAGPALDFPLSCTNVTPKPVRALLCPDPWSVVGYPRPRLHEQTVLSQPIGSADLHRIDWQTVAVPGGGCAGHADALLQHAHAAAVTPRTCASGDGEPMDLDEAVDTLLTMRSSAQRRRWAGQDSNLRPWD